jgi:tetratricopeptide (TPR) repeat protein
VSDGVGEARPEAEGELALARIALDSGEAGHAARHAGNAIASDPTLRDAYELLDQLAAAGDALSCFPVGGRVYIGAAAARSYLLARQGALDEAFGLLCQAAAMMPGTPWAAGWLAAPGASVTSLASRMDPGRASAALHRLAMSLPDPAGDAAIAALRPFLGVARHVVTACPGRADFLSLLSALARRLGAHEEAITWTQRAERAAPTFVSAVMLGYALRSAARYDEAHEAWVRALSRNPSDVDLRVDIGELLVTRGRLDDGIRWLEEGLALEPDHPKAFPSACGVRYLRDNDITHLVTLADWWRAHPGHDYADVILGKVCQGRPWLGQVPWPTEAVSNMLRSVIDGGRGLAAMREETVRLTLSALEVPSAVAAARAALPGLCYAADPPAPAPDIRVPLASVRHRLWTYSGVDATPAVPAPSPAAIAALHAASAGGWPAHPVAAYDAALPLAGLPVGDLLGLMARVPPPPGTAEWRDVHAMHPGYWPRTAQAWACLGLLHHKPDEPWPASTRRAVLVDLTRGVEDWATDAAMYALVTAAWADPAIRADVVGLIGHRFLDGIKAKERREVTIIEPMAHLTLATPDMDRAVVALVRDFLKLMAGPDDAEPAPKDGARARRGLFRRR